MIARIIATIIFGGFGIVLFVVGLRNFIQQRKLLRDPQQVDAVIVVSQVKKQTTGKHNDGELRDGTTNSYIPIVKFKYELHGQQYESELLRPSEIETASASESDVAERIAPYPVGAKVRAYFQPDAPGKAFLNAERSAGPMVFMTIGLLIGPVVWFVGRWL